MYLSLGDRYWLYQFLSALRANDDTLQTRLRQVVGHEQFRERLPDDTRATLDEVWFYTECWNYAS